MVRAHAFEIDMLKLGDADSILISRWKSDSEVTRILIDGGNPDDSNTVASFLSSTGVTTIDHLVCTHSDKDHAGGLQKLVASRQFKIKKAWVHRLDNYVDLKKVSLAIEQAKSVVGFAQSLNLVTHSINISRTLLEELDDQKIEVAQPFADAMIDDFLLVCGPTEDYYRELVNQFRDVNSLVKMSEISVAQKAVEARTTLLENPRDTAENNSSAILVAIFDDKQYVFTADASVDALRPALLRRSFSNVMWMQIPHHGSINNINREVIEHLKPSVAYVSAVGDNSHPHTAVIDAFKSFGGEGARVYGTYRNGHLWHHSSNAPSRASYVTAEPL